MSWRESAVAPGLVGAGTCTEYSSNGAAPRGASEAAETAKRVPSGAGASRSGMREYRPVPLKPGRGRSTR